MSASLCIVIVSYNVRDLLRDRLRTLSDQRVIVVDNASADDSATTVHTEFPAVELIANTNNRGFAAACNQGIAVGAEDFILILNPDTTVTPTALQTLLDVMQAEPRAAPAARASSTRMVHCNLPADVFPPCHACFWMNPVWESFSAAPKFSATIA